MLFGFRAKGMMNGKFSRKLVNEKKMIVYGEEIIIFK